jgi:hypothetical protein
VAAVSREQWWRVLSALSRGDVKSWDLHAAQAIRAGASIKAEATRWARDHAMWLVVR